MTGDGGGTSPTTDAGRQAAVDVLCQAFAEDRIDVEDFERRVELAHRADTVGELRVLLADLPKPLPVPTPSETDSPADRAAGERWRLAEPVHVPEQSAIMGVLGGGVRKGAWHPARYNYAVGILGGVELDFRECVLPAHTEVRCFATMGGVELIVPPDVIVDASGIGILGGFDHAAEGQEAPPGAPVIRVTGLAFLGGVSVQVRRSGESARDAKRRLRGERKRRRRLTD
ncbi:MAG: DUF1707 domain-containing protein [Gemmatimonadota bacterium]